MNKIITIIAQSLIQDMRPSEKVEFLKEGISSLRSATDSKNWKEVNGVTNSICALLPEHVAKELTEKANQAFAEAFHAEIEKLNTKINWASNFKHKNACSECGVELSN